MLEPGSAQIGHNSAHDQGFTVSRSVEGSKVLLIDDTFASGARVQSAASALSLAGASVVSVLVVARVIKPSFNESVWASGACK